MTAMSPPNDSWEAMQDALAHWRAGRAAGIRASTRAGAARLAFHFYNTETDADRATAALT